jgi:hypothetical protein
MSDSKLPEEGHNEVQPDESLSEKELARRKMLKRAVLGTGVVATAPVWMGPVVNTVILPAHAQASSFSSTTHTYSFATTLDR